MISRRLKQLLMPLVTVRSRSPWRAAPTYAQELLALERRVAVARLGEGVPQRYIRQWHHDDRR